MKTARTIFCSALSISVLFTVEPAAAQTSSEWSCNVGTCGLEWSQHRETSSPAACVTEQKNFFINKIENAITGPNSGSFNFVGSLVDETQGTQTLDSFFGDTEQRDFLKELVLTVHAPANVEGVSVKLTDTDGNPLGMQTKIGTDKSVMYWSHDVAPSPASGQTIQFEIQGNALSGPDVDASAESPMVWLNVSGTRCQSL